MRGWMSTPNRPRPERGRAAPEGRSSIPLPYRKEVIIITFAPPRMPDILIVHDPYGRSISEVTGIEHPVLLARYAEGCQRSGALAKALTIRASLVADGRCWRCGRRLAASTALTSGAGRDCIKHY